jgi:hypothetical protein
MSPRDAAFAFFPMNSAPGGNLFTPTVVNRPGDWLCLMMPR